MCEKPLCRWQHSTSNKFNSYSKSEDSPQNMTSSLTRSLKFHTLFEWVFPRLKPKEPVPTNIVLSDVTITLYKSLTYATCYYDCGELNILPVLSSRSNKRAPGDERARRSMAGARRRTGRAGDGAACGARAEQLPTHLAFTDTTLAPTGKFSRM